MSRYIYTPFNSENDEDIKRKYLEYINSLKTGEIIINSDLKDPCVFDKVDVYVTREGIELPIPATGKLRELVIKNLNHMDQKKRMSLINNNLKNIEKLNLQIMEYHKYVRDAAILLADDIARENEIKYYIEEINENTVHLIKHLDFMLPDMEIFDSYNEKIENLTNIYESTLRDYKGGDISTIGGELDSILTNINGYFTEAEKYAANKLGKSSGSITLQKGENSTVTKSYPAWDFGWLKCCTSQAYGDTISKVDNYFTNNFASYSDFSNSNHYRSNVLISKNGFNTPQFVGNDCNLVDIAWCRIYYSSTVNSKWHEKVGSDSYSLNTHIAGNYKFPGDAEQQKYAYNWWVNHQMPSGYWTGSSNPKFEISNANKYLYGADEYSLTYKNANGIYQPHDTSKFNNAKGIRELSGTFSTSAQNTRFVNNFKSHAERPLGGGPVTISGGDNTPGSYSWFRMVRFTFEGTVNVVRRTTTFKKKTLTLPKT